MSFLEEWRSQNAVAAIGVVSLSGESRSALSASFADLAAAAPDDATPRYLRETREIRMDPLKLHPWARSIFTLAIPFFSLPPSPSQLPTPCNPIFSGAIAAYATRMDYHIFAKSILANLAENMRSALEREFHAEPAVDTKPLAERSLAILAELGAIGRNQALRIPGHGSGCFLCELVTNLKINNTSKIKLPPSCSLELQHSELRELPHTLSPELQNSKLPELPLSLSSELQHSELPELPLSCSPELPHSELPELPPSLSPELQHSEPPELPPSSPLNAKSLDTACSDCGACARSCPTGALSSDAPSEFRAELCRSHLTMEKRGILSHSESKLLGNWIFGCDECLKPCPDTRLPSSGEVDLEWLLESSTGEIRRAISGTAMDYAGITLLRRNAIIALANTRNSAAVDLAARFSQRTSSELLMDQWEVVSSQ